MTSRRARCRAVGRKRLMTMPMTVKVASTGRTKMAVSNASRRDGLHAGPKCATLGRWRQSTVSTSQMIHGVSTELNPRPYPGADAARSDSLQGLVVVRHTPRYGDRLV